MKPINIVGKRFGKLVVVKEDHSKNRKSWICVCDCGKTSNVFTQNLTHGNSISCGKCTAGFYKRYRKEHMIWASMKSRCLNPRHRFYKDYGDRGITIDESWLDFKMFVEDMGRKPKNKSLDRINNSLGYSKLNCRWASQVEQKNNCRNNRLLTKNGVTKTMAQWARGLGLNYRTLKSRLNIQHMSVDKALTNTLTKDQASKLIETLNKR